jgi:NADH-quinone oxidoreductase subunit C
MELESSILTRLKEKIPQSVVEVAEFRGELTVVVNREHIVPVCAFLRDDPELCFDFLSDLTAVDWLGREPRFDVTYNLYSIEKNHRVRLKVRLEQDQNIESVTSVWSGANWFEREVFDLFGIRFENHPDLRRILMPDDWEGHPLRKDFPLTREEIMFTYNNNRPPRVE